MVGGADGEDVPSVGRDDPSTALRTGYSGDEVDVAGGVGTPLESGWYLFIGLACVSFAPPGLAGIRWGLYPRLTPWAAFFRSFGAGFVALLVVRIVRLGGCRTGGGWRGWGGCTRC